MLYLLGNLQGQRMVRLLYNVLLLLEISYSLKRGWMHCGGLVLPVVLLRLVQRNLGGTRTESGRIRRWRKAHTLGISAIGARRTVVQLIALLVSKILAPWIENVFDESDGGCFLLRTWWLRRRKLWAVQGRLSTEDRRRDVRVAGVTDEVFD